MKTIEIKGWIFAKPNWDASDLTYEFSVHDYEEWGKSADIDDATWKKYRKVSEHVITFEAADFDPKRIAVEALEAQKTALRAELGKRITEIEEQISKLLALPYVAQTEELSPQAPERDMSNVVDAEWFDGSDGKIPF